jgi:hypothetical protein
LSKKKKKQSPSKRSSPTEEPATGFARFLRVVPLIALCVTLVGLAATLTLLYFTVLRKPDLAVSLRVSKLEPLTDGTLRGQFEVSIENRGPKTVSDLYWHLLVPERDVVAVDFQAGARPLTEKTLLPDGTKAVRLQGRATFPIHRGGYQIGVLTMQMREQPVEVRWQITCCDDKLFPPDGDKLGRLQIDPNALQRWQVIESQGPREDLRVRP